MAARSDHPFLRRALAAGGVCEEATFEKLDISSSSFLAALTALQRSSAQMFTGAELRAGADCDEDLRAVCYRALTVPLDYDEATNFFKVNFTPFKVSDASSDDGFLTGYYEPVVEAAVEQSTEFAAPILPWPTDLAKCGSALLPSRADIEQSIGRRKPLVWVRDQIEAFMIQVQGSARLRMTDGRRLRLVYDGRNGLPYTSIGRILIAEGHIDDKAMSLDILKRWFRKAGQDIGQAGRDIMWRNQSFVFFRLETDCDQGPIGGQGISLEALMSLAVDRNIWPYGTPVCIGGNLSAASPEWWNFTKLLIAQDTGSAIIGPARGDLYVGSGESAGSIAGRLRHNVEFTVLAPSTNGGRHET